MLNINYLASTILRYRLNYHSLLTFFAIAALYALQSKADAATLPTDELASSSPITKTVLKDAGSDYFTGFGRYTNGHIKASTNGGFIQEWDYDTKLADKTINTRISGLTGVDSTAQGDLWVSAGKNFYKGPSDKTTWNLSDYTTVPITGIDATANLTDVAVGPTLTDGRQTLIGSTDKAGGTAGVWLFDAVTGVGIRQLDPGKFQSIDWYKLDANYSANLLQSGGNFFRNTNNDVTPTGNSVYVGMGNSTEPLGVAIGYTSSGTKYMALGQWNRFDLHMLNPELVPLSHAVVPDAPTLALLGIGAAVIPRRRNKK